MKAKYFWNQESAPIEIKVKAKKYLHGHSIMKWRVPNHTAE